MPVLPMVGLALVTSCAAAGRPILAEIFYDALGDDTGYEFVELLNPTDRTLPLAGARLEVGDGSGPGRWSLRWTGQSGDSIAARGRFVIGGARVEPAPGSIVNLSLQNGPDAVRVVWPDGAAEVVGYGALEPAEYFCGAPAPDAPSGMSLARVPDDADLGSNALDFRAAAPSPGRSNRAARDLACVAGSLTIVPEQPDPLAEAAVRVRIANLGAEDVAAGEARCVVRTVDAGSARDVVEQPLAAVASGDTMEAELGVALAEGRATLVLAIELPGDEARSNDTDSLRVRVGPGPLTIEEIQFHPRHDEGEWVEIRNRSGLELDPRGFTLSDRGVARGRIEGDGPPLAAESLAVLAQDRDALLRRFPEIDRARVWSVRPWSSLNNSNDATGRADAVVLRELDGAPCARVEYSATGVPSGTPIERRDGEWLPARVEDGTPLAPPRPPVAIAGRFEVEPRRLRATSGRARLSWSLPWPRGRVSIEAYDLGGGRVALPFPETLVAGRGESEWSVGAMPPGIYLVVLRARAESAADRLTVTRAMRIERVAP
jgi:hypothetical protein